MYYYVFDPPNGPKEYERIAQIKAYLTQIGIGGETVQPHPGRGVEDLVAAALLKRYSTLVAVGGVGLITKMAASLKGREAVFGIIPLFSHPDIAELIGSSEWKMAADALPRRRLQERNIAYLNGMIPFITPARLSLGDTQLTVKTDQFSFQVTGGVVTLQPQTNRVQFCHEMPVATRSWLQRFAKPAPSIEQTYLQMQRFHLSAQSSLPISVAGADIVSLPVHVDTGTDILRLIVGPGA